MLFFFAGSEDEPQGRFTDYPCGVCGVVRPFTVAARYHYFQIYFFGIAGLTTYTVTCGVCGGSRRLSRKRARELKREGYLVAPTIPAFRRFGLLMLAALAVVPITIAEIGLLAAGIEVAALAGAVILPSVIDEVSHRGLKGLASADKPLSLFESEPQGEERPAPRVRDDRA